MQQGSGTMLLAVPTSNVKEKTDLLLISLAAVSDRLVQRRHILLWTLVL
jgi:hypothetical protein